MYIAFQRTIGTSSTSMILHEDWEAIKIKICDHWGTNVEHAFDRHYSWSALRSGTVITYAGDMYQVFNGFTKDFADELFQGRHIEIFDEDK